MFTIVLASVPATIIVMSFLYGIATLYSLIKDLKKKIWLDSSANPSKSESDILPRIAVIVPLYKEDRQHIMETFESISSQLYPLDKIAVFIVLENGDYSTRKYVEELKHILIEAKILVHIHINNGPRTSKAAAINSVLQKIIDKYDVVLILDAGDRILDRNYIVKCVELIRNGYNIIGAKVYRVGRNIIAKFSYIDTVLWYNVNLPVIHSITKVPFLSGEGMVVTTNFLKRIGLLPEVLAEDSYIAMLGLIYNERIGLINSVILEGAPSSLSGLVKQRLRWYRGGLECLKDFFIKYRKRVPSNVVIRICIAYFQLIALTAPFISLIVIAISLFIEVPSFLLILAKIEIISILLSPGALYIVNEIKDKTIFLAPFNWFLQSFIALIAIIPVNIPWLRTTNRASIDIS
ncbi:MAG: glycosyltransferase family 2 protein [Ignisphaera sp.]